MFSVTCNPCHYTAIWVSFSHAVSLTYFTNLSLDLEACDKQLCIFRSDVMESEQQLVPLAFKKCLK